ncbi:hypothetical protein BKA81DRAFT_356383 [Phyllosticta paracitricarpa]|uniref:HTH APSES-type domain-containing protein n=1 Tax=Phyllosticta paracitricarpa TaxID=2016321 RepID=A0ABR1MUS1_9PEZI
MPPETSPPRIYSATYSNVPVYEFNVKGNHVMRRRADDWINATHILKVADFDKPARTRILEREVQKGVHEKVQGGYGKYQGTWIPLHDGRYLAERNNVLDKLLPIFDFVPGDRSPPPAPKHATAASNRPKAARQSLARRLPAYTNMSQMSEDHYENVSQPYEEQETPDNVTIVSESMMDEHDMMPNSQYSNRGHKRKRDTDQHSLEDKQHQMWADALLDYFMLLESEDRFPEAPMPPPTVNLDRMIDEKGHSAMHWAAAMGDVPVVKDLIDRGARIDSLSNNLETPLMRAVMFTNNFDKQTMPQLFRLLQATVVRTDWFGSTVFHHIAATTSSKNKYACARYYLDCIVNKLSETWKPEEVTRLLNQQDKNGDTAIIIAARNGARKVVRALLGRNVAVDVPNNHGESADELIRDLNARRRDARHRVASSSPFAPDGRGLNGTMGTPSFGFRNGTGPPGGLSNATAQFLKQTYHSQYSSQTAQTLMSKVLPTINEKLENLARAYDADLVEKEAEAADADRVVRKRQAEVDALRRQLRDMGVQDIDGAIAASVAAAGDGAGGTNGSFITTDMEADARSQEDLLESLTRDAEALVEMEQHILLQEKLRAEEAAQTPSTNAPSQQQQQQTKAEPTPALHQQHRQQPPVSPTTASSPAYLREKMRLALALRNAQTLRRSLVAEVVRNMSLAGMGGERADEFKRLISGALGLRPGEDVEAMLPDILGELEEAREREVLENAAAEGEAE